MRHLLPLFLLLSLSFIVKSQNILPPGAWRSHEPKRVGISVTQSEDQIFYATRTGLMILDKDEIAPRFISTVDGLSGVDIRLLKFHKPSNQLVIFYEDGVIDLYQEGNITTVNSIKNFSNVIGEKLINDVYQHDNQTLYLAASYGVSVFNIENTSFSFTTFTGEASVLSVAVHENYLYAATVEGVYRTSLNNINAADFNTWNFLGVDEGFPDDYSSSSLEVYKDELYIGVNEDIYVLENGVPVLFSDEDPTFQLRYLSAEGDFLLGGFRCVGEGCGNGKVVYYNIEGEQGNLANGCIGRTNYAIEDQYSRFWLADEWRGFRWLDNKDDNICNTFDINSPYSQRVWDLELVDDKLWLASGAYEPNRTPIPIDAGMASFEEGHWEIYNRWTKDEFKGVDLIQRDDDVFALVDVEGNTTTGKVYGASYYTGLIAINDEEIKLFDDTNSPLSNTTGDDTRTRVSGLKSDDEGNLWVSNYRPVSGKALHRLAPDGTWISFGDTGGAVDLFDIDIDRNGYKWVVIGKSNAGVLLFDEGDIDNINDDRSRIFTSNNSELETNETNCLVVDRDGDVWVGTNEGIIIFECGGSAFNENCIGSKRILELDGFAEYLFKTQVVQALAVDGANRKWVGTANGVYLISADGKELFAHFTEDNSPLFDNSIRSIAVNDSTGEVFFGTDKGVISYQGDAIEGRRFHHKNPTVFPNPVRPEYEGPIMVKGLSVNASVKITDVSGTLVYETQALGGQLVWDGRDYNGRKVQTGVYLVFSTTNPREVGFGEPDTAVAKILFIN